jgi:hypothetical protein
LVNPARQQATRRHLRCRPAPTGRRRLRGRNAALTLRRHVRPCGDSRISGETVARPLGGRFRFGRPAPVRPIGAASEESARRCRSVQRATKVPKNGADIQPSRLPWRSKQSKAPTTKLPSVETPERINDPVEHCAGLRSGLTNSRLIISARQPSLFYLTTDGSPSSLTQQLPVKGPIVAFFSGAILDAARCIKALEPADERDEGYQDAEHDDDEGMACGNQALA